MKNSKYLVLLLAAGLVLVIYRWVWTDSSSESAPLQTGNVTIEDIMTRCSVRSYTDRKVSKETIDTLLRAAMSAPTAVNKQPWRMVVVDSRELLDSIATGFGSMQMAEEAQLAIVLCGDMQSALEGEGKEFWVQDVSAATENLLLAAHAVGLGAVWCGIYPIQERVRKFSAMLALPSDIVPMACVCIGYPKGETEPKDKWKPENIRLNSWEVPYPD